MKYECIMSRYFPSTQETSSGSGRGRRKGRRRKRRPGDFYAKMRTSRVHLHFASLFESSARTSTHTHKQKQADKHTHTRMKNLNYSKYRLNRFILVLKLKLYFNYFLRLYFLFSQIILRINIKFSNI